VTRDSLCVAWPNDVHAAMTLLGVSVGVVLSYSGSSGSLCVVPPPAAHAPMSARRPSGLLMVHTALTLAENVWLCGMTRV